MGTLDGLNGKKNEKVNLGRLEIGWFCRFSGNKKGKDKPVSLPMPRKMENLGPLGLGCNNWEQTASTATERPIFCQAANSAGYRAERIFLALTKF
jgi:hypothetical protein